MEIPFSSIIYSIFGGMVSAGQAAQNGLITGCTGVIGATAAHLAFANPAVTATAGIVVSVYALSANEGAFEAVGNFAGRAASGIGNEVRERGHIHGRALVLAGAVVGLATGLMPLQIAFVGAAISVCAVQRILN